MYRTIDTAFWTDPAVRHLAPLDKLLFAYFITNPQARISGLYCISLPEIIHQTGLSKKRVGYGIDTLSESGFILWDTLSEVVWVRNMLRHQTGNKPISPKIAAAVARDLSMVHKSPLINEFMKHYDTISIPYPYPIDRGAQSETESETDTERDTETESAGAAAPNPASDSDFVLDGNSLSDSEKQQPEIRSDVITVTLQAVFGRNGDAKQFKADQTTFKHLADQLNAGLFDHLAGRRVDAAQKIVDQAKLFTRDKTLKKPVAAFMAWCRENRGPAT